jgi:hypothetical protein
MSRKPIIGHVGLLSAEALSRLRHRCGWKNCTAATEIGKALPPGWRWLSLWTGPVGSPPWADGNTEDRDAVLCPEHARLLHRELLEPIPERMGKTKGNA